MSRNAPQCGFCEEPSKYRCPKCEVFYCSLKCFKCPEHVHDETKLKEKSAKQDPGSNESGTTEHSKDKPEPAETSRFDFLLRDKQIAYLLKFPAVQFHLATIYHFLTDATITGQVSSLGRREYAKKKLNELRLGGSEENEAIEEFANRVLTLMEENQEDKKRETGQT